MEGINVNDEWMEDEMENKKTGTHTRFISQAGLPDNCKWYSVTLALPILSLLQTPPLLREELDFWPAKVTES